MGEHSWDGHSMLSIGCACWAMWLMWLQSFARGAYGRVSSCVWDATAYWKTA